jgi:hypothetical protein
MPLNPIKSPLNPIESPLNPIKKTDGSAQESGEDAIEDLPDGESVGAEDGHGHDVQMSHRATFPNWEGVQL